MGQIGGPETSNRIQHVNAFNIVKQMSVDDREVRIYSNPVELITPTEMNDGWQ